MDTSEQYIRMCEKAEKIQEMWGFNDGDYYQVRFDQSDGVQFEGKTIITCLCVSCNVKDSYGSMYICDSTREGKYIWLPRQDQLQEMVNTGNEIYSFAVWCNPETACLHGDRESGMFNHEYCSICIDDRNWKRRTFTSMEQLWLAFVMNERYSKLWNGENWIEIDTS